MHTGSATCAVSRPRILWPS